MKWCVALVVVVLVVVVASKKETVRDEPEAVPPAVLHQTWKVKELSEMDAATADGVRSWQVVNPNLRQILYDDQDCAEFIRQHYPEYAGLYFDKLKRPVERADVFRYLVVHKYGGWYADIDTTARKPLSDLSGDLVVAKEFEQPGGGYQVLQYFFGATPRHPFFVDVLLPMIEERVEQYDELRESNPDLWVLTCTGPYVFTAALERYGHVDVLPVCTFGAYQTDCGGYLDHHFSGTWKSNWRT